ncbi:hypothetical protein Tbd_1315 [Thiobacillus denitrificans ATCC 25259]|uniref:Integrase catalytic domain-containing protein n=1 Tax=Thiobacillus denitrificans (strain ATCC 25259 / T1) TaxID=292415 RepID=Q3SJ99_THIDA|nr:hypothetical protein [Thiobacillus denitrificans]AAZ97268.1 hypothetical protein Tbd_1315 [Thiobacillus denitrificans ATCC 25259]
MDKQQRWKRTESLMDTPAVDTWPTVDVASLRPEHQEKYAAKREAVRLYVQGYPTAAIFERTGVPAGALVHMAKRCTTIAEDGQIMGFRALIPYSHLKAYERKAEVKSKRQEQRGGHSGALGAVLSRYPEVEAKLISLIRKEAKSREIHEHRIRPKDLHRIFLSCLKNNGVSLGEWPFNTKHLGIRSIQTYMRTLLNTSFERAVNTRGEQEARAHLAVGRGIAPLLLYEEPFDAVELDAYDINAFLSVVFQTPEGAETDVLLERLWLLAMIDRVSGAILTYSIVYSSEVSANDVLTLIRDAVARPWRPKELTIPGLSYPEGGGLPSGVFPECEGAVWGSILLDGALAHLAKAVYETARRHLGFIVNWGPSRHFERRPNVERLFKSISDDVFLRFPSTTGSNPGNGRAIGAEKNATRYRIRSTEVEELLDVYVAQFNATPSEGLSYRSPLEYIEYFLAEGHFIARRLPRVSESGNPMPVRKECTVRGGAKSGRRPYIELDRARYTSSVLAQLLVLVGKKIVIEIDDEDLRQVKAYLPSGAELGFLKASGRWAITKHSRKTRQAINRLVHRRALVVSELDDPVQAYMRYLGSREKASPGRKVLPSQSKATEATRVARESGLPLVLGPPYEARQTRETVSSEESGTLMDKPPPDLNELINRQR